MTNPRQFDAVLFDLDGTLIDTAPDMVAILDAQLAAANRDPIDYDVGNDQPGEGGRVVRIRALRAGWVDAHRLVFFHRLGGRQNLLFIDHDQVAECTVLEIRPYAS